MDDMSENYNKKSELDDAFEQGRQYEREINEQNEKHRIAHEKNERFLRNIIIAFLVIGLAALTFDNEKTSVGLEADGSLYFQISKYYGLKISAYELRYSYGDNMWEYKLPDGEWNYILVE